MNTNQNADMQQQITTDKKSIYDNNNKEGFKSTQQNITQKQDFLFGTRTLIEGPLIFKFTNHPPYFSNLGTPIQEAIENNVPSSNYYKSISQVRKETGEIGIGVVAGKCSPLGWDYDIFYPTSLNERVPTPEDPIPKQGYFNFASGSIIDSFTLPGGIEDDCFLIVKPRITMPSDNSHQVFVNRMFATGENGRFQATGDIIVRLDYTDGDQQVLGTPVINRFLDKRSSGTNSSTGIFSNDFEITLMELVPKRVKNFSINITIQVTIYSSIRYFYPNEMEEAYNYFKNYGAIDLRFQNSQYNLHTETAPDGFEYAPNSSGCIVIPEINYEFHKAVINAVAENNHITD